MDVRRMIEFVFTLEDLARVRFAISPAWEAVASLRALRDPANAAAHLPWVRTAREAVADLDLTAPMSLIAMWDYTPDFVIPPPDTPLTTIEDDLARIAATPPDRVREEVRIVASRVPEPGQRAFLDDPATATAALVETLRAYWERAIAPWWDRVRALLEADLQARARRLADAGTAAMLDDLSPQVRFTGDRLQVRHTVLDRVCELRGRGLVLNPSAFWWVRPLSTINEPWQPALVYPARGIGLLWDAPPAATDGLARVLGRTRAELLAALGAPTSTTRLAERLGLAPGGVSEHLTALAAAGLLSRRREGREVLYLRTPLADALLDGGAGFGQG